MNYVAQFYKSSAETRNKNASDFFKNIEMTDEISEKIDKLKSVIKKAQKEINDSEENIKNLSGMLYTKECEPIDKKYVLHYSGRNNDCNFSIPTGIPVNLDDLDEEEQIKVITINVENKTGEIYVPVGYLYENAAVIAREYKYSINGTYSKTNFTTLNTYIVGIFDSYCYSANYSATERYARDAILRKIAGAPFLEKFYGIDNLKNSLGQDYTLYQVHSNYQFNKSFEIILKTAPDSIKRRMIVTHYKDAMPVYKIFGLKKETWDKVIEKHLEEYVYELDSWITDPKFNKTEMEWIEFIEYINSKQEDLDFYEIEYAPRWSARNARRSEEHTSELQSR